MSIRRLETFVVDCNTCDAIYADVVDVAEDTIQTFAVRDGWRVNDDGTHTCSACRKRAKCANCVTCMANA